MQMLYHILVMGDKEMAVCTVAVRARGNVDLSLMPVDDFIAKIVAGIAAIAYYQTNFLTIYGL